MGICASRAKPPAVIIPDPKPDEQVTVLDKHRGFMSSVRGHDEQVTAHDVTAPRTRLARLSENDVCEGEQTAEDHAEDAKLLLQAAALLQERRTALVVRVGRQARVQAASAPRGQPHRPAEGPARPAVLLGAGRLRRRLVAAVVLAEVGQWGPWRGRRAKQTASSVAKPAAVPKLEKASPASGSDAELIAILEEQVRAARAEAAAANRAANA